MKEKALLYFECSFFFAISTLVITGYIDNIGAGFPLVFELASAVIFIVLLFSVFASLKDIRYRLSHISAFGIGSAALAINHLVLTNLNSNQTVTIPVLYFIVIVGCGLIGKANSWLFPFLLFTIGELLYSILQLHNSDFHFLVNKTLTYAQANILSVFYLFISGFFPSIISSRFLKAASDKPPKKEVPNSENFSSIRTDTAKISAKTQSSSLTSEFIIDKKNSNYISGVDELLASVVYFMKRNFKAFSALGFTFDSSRQSFELNSFQSKSINVIKETTIPLGSGIIGKVGIDKKIFMSGDLSFYNIDVEYYTTSHEINSILVVPVVSEQSELLGALVLDSVDKNAFRDQDKDILKRFSSLAAALITNARMRIFQERTAKTFQIFYQASHQLTTALNTSDVFDVMFQMFLSVVRCNRQMAILFDEEKHVGSVFKINGKSADIQNGFEFPINAGLYSFAFKKRKIVNISDYRQYQSKYYRFIPGENIDQNLRSLIIFPINDDEGRCSALFSIESDTPNDYIGGIEQILTTLVENASIAFTRAILYQRMEKLATTDGLTELSNHRHFQELLSKELERTRRYGSFTSLLLMDIDHFKTFNDTYGHPVGDLVLKEIAACIRKSIRLNDMPARYGGEEFTVILPETNEQGAKIIAERIRSTIEKHIIVSLERQLHVTVSIGVACYPSMASTPQQLIDNADKALYFSKENGRNRISMYIPGIGENKQ